MSFAIATDTSANLPTPLLREHDITVIPFTYLYDGEEHSCLDTEAFDGAAYYNAIRGGMRVTTAQINPYRYVEYLKPVLERGDDLLFVGMSSGISGSYSMAEIAADQLAELFPERKIRLVDTLGASLGEGLLVMRAIEHRDNGMSIDEVYGDLMDVRRNMGQIFTVDDLSNLKRTGRLFNAAAAVASVLQIKPLLKGNEEGHIVACGVARGFKKAVAAMAKKYDELVEDAGSQTIGIAHADCPDAARFLTDLLNTNNPPKDIMTVCYEPVTGSHVRACDGLVADRQRIS